MNSCLRLLLLLTFNFIACYAASETEFVILILSYNNERYAWDNLKSVCHQKSSKPYQVICVNDNSKDNTKEIMNKYVKEHNLESLVTLTHNEKRVGAMANFYNVIWSHIPDHKVVLCVDGDDTLAHDEVLLALEKAYQQGDIWMTWGQARIISNGEFKSSDLPSDVWTKKSLRSLPWMTCHLKTFKAGLFKKIKRADFLYGDEFFPMTSDQAFMFPMLEMCAPRIDGEKPRCTFISEVLYLYNDRNPIGDSHVDMTFQRELEAIIRKKKPYEPLTSL
jgi:glycosyltransferase involved in cell wall biosynthesis